MASTTRPGITRSSQEHFLDWLRDGLKEVGDRRTDGLEPEEHALDARDPGALGMGGRQQEGARGESRGLRAAMNRAPPSLRARCPSAPRRRTSVEDERHALVRHALVQALEDVIGVDGVPDREVEVRREAALVAEDELADRGPALEDDRVVLEQASSRSQSRKCSWANSRYASLRPRTRKSPETSRLPISRSSLCRGHTAAYISG